MDPGSIVQEFGLREGMRVADFGAGSGYFTLLIARIIGEEGKIIGLDILDSAIETIQARAIASDLHNVQAVKANLEARGGSGLYDASQDMVLLANMLFQNEHRGVIIREAHRVLVPLGKLVIIDWQKGAGGPGPPDEYRESKEVMQELAQAEGFRYEKDINAGSFHYGMIFHKP